MEVPAIFSRACFRLRLRDDGRPAGGERGCRWDAAFSVASTPHPRPLPATRFARGGRGEARRSPQVSIPRTLSHEARSEERRVGEEGWISGAAASLKKKHRGKAGGEVVQVNQ